MTNFEERLARIEARAEANGVKVGDPFAEDTPSEPTVLGQIFLIPFGILFGALAVLVGGIIELNFVQEAPVTLQSIPPELSITTIGIALGISFVADRLFRGGAVWKLAITAGFVAMILGEVEIAEMFPKVWVTLYTVDEYSVDTFMALAG